MPIKRLKKSFDKHQHRIPHVLLGMIIVMSSLFLVFSLEPLRTAQSFSTSWTFTDANDYSAESGSEVSGGVGTLFAGIDLADDDNSASGFGGGSLDGTQWDAGNSWVEISTTTNAFDLPDDSVSTDWIDMGGTTLLLHLNDGSGATSFDDRSGNTNDGSCTNCPDWVSDGKLGGSYDFNGSNDEITLASQAVTNIFPATFTISFWVKPDGVDDRPTFGFTGSGGSNVNNPFASYDSVLNVSNGASTQFLTVLPVAPANQWSHYAIVDNGTHYRVFLNGDLQYSTAISVNPGYGSNRVFTIGESGFSSGFADWFNGQYDEFAIIGRGLSDAEVQQVYQVQYPDVAGYVVSRVMDAGSSQSWDQITWLTSQPFYKELPDNGAIETAYSDGNMDMTGNILLYHLNESSGATSFTDSSGNGNTGSCSTCPDQTDGQFSGAFEFNGTNDVIDVGAALLPTTDAFASTTVMAWIKTIGAVNNGGVVTQYGGSAPDRFGFRVGSTGELRYWKGSDLVLSTGLVNDGKWHFIGFTKDASQNVTLYIDGVADGTGTDTNDFENTNTKVGAFTSSNNPFDGVIDEVAIFNRALTADEMLDAYRRGANRLRFQLRSCDDSACSGDGSFIGDEGTVSSTYSELDSTTTGTPSLTLSGIADNQYFQYLAWFQSDTTTYSPELTSINFGEGSSYSTTSPSIVPNSGQLFTEVTGFTETLGAGNQGSVTYQVSHDGNNFYYHDGANWVTTTADVSESDTATVVNANIASFDDDIGSGSFFWKAFLTSNGAQQVELDQIAIDFTFDGSQGGGVNALFDIEETGGVLTVDSIVFTTTSGSTNAETNLTLTDFSTTTAYVRGSFSQTAGCTNVTSGGAITSTLYRSAVGESCSPSEEDCYIQTSCTFSNCSGGGDTTADYECAFALHHFADPTNGGGPYTAQNWAASITIEDSSAQTDSDSTTFDIDALAGLSSGALLDYGTLAIGVTSDDAALTIINTGNVEIDTNVSGTQMPCVLGTLATTSQHYASTTGVAYASMTALSSTPQLLELDLAKQTVSTTLATTGIQWKLQIPSETLSGICSGTTTISAVASS